MKIRNRNQASCLATVMIMAMPPGAASAALKNPVLVWEDLPRLRTGVKAWSHTSKSPLNQTIMDWTHYTARDGQDRELAFFRGSSGMLIHSWFDPYKSVGRLKLYLDNPVRPAHDQPFARYFEAPAAPNLMWHEVDNMLWAYPCLPFDSLFKAAFTDSSQWYQFTVQAYREPRFSEALSGADVAAVQARLAGPAGAFPGLDSGSRAATGNADIPAGGAAVLFTRDLPGVIRSIRLAPASLAAGALDRIWVRMVTDSLVTAEVPLPLFFGGYPGVDFRSSRGLPAGAQGSGLYCWFPMPFWKNFRLEILNRGPGPISLPYRIGWSDRNVYSRDSTGIFRVQYHGGVARQAGEPPFVQLETRGAGHLVGCTSQLTGSIEGNFSIFVDGSKTPAIETTGGEDFFNHSYGIHPGVSGPLQGGLAKDIAYRFLLLDYVPFTRSLVFTQDHGHVFQGDRDGTFLSAVFYYHKPRPSLLPTDSLDIGEAVSETAHGYRITGSRARLQADTSAYEGYFTAPFPDRGRWTEGETRFRVAILPENDGVRIRKRINQAAYHQEVEVFVDGVKAGAWFEQGSNYMLNYAHAGYRQELETRYRNLGQEVPTWQNGRMPFKFRDTEFEIPAARTRGKAFLDISLKTVGSLAVPPGDAGLVNEYYYWIFVHAGSPGPTGIGGKRAGRSGSRPRRDAQSPHDLTGRRVRGAINPTAGIGFPGLKERK